MDEQQGYGLNDEQQKHIAAAVYGENRFQGDDAIMNTASSYFNRLRKGEWKNLTPDDLAYKTFYAIHDAVSGKNTGYTDALSGKFKDKGGDAEYKRIFAKVAAMNRGTLPTTDAQFYFNQSEINRQTKNKSFDFKKVEEGKPFKAGKQTFRTFHYK